MPVLIINLDGAFGFWSDDQRGLYFIRPKAVQSLVQLSFDFRLVAVSAQKKKHINGLINKLKTFKFKEE